MQLRTGSNLRIAGSRGGKWPLRSCAIGNNFYLTTSGNFRTQTLIDGLLEVGADRILFSTDWPFENVDHAAHWFDSASISEADRLKIGRTNAIELFNLDL